MEATIQKDSWFEKGVFKYFNFIPAVVKEFTIDPKASLVVRKEVKMKLATMNVTGSCKTCGWKSKVLFGNPSNWVRHLLLVSCVLFIYYLFLMYSFFVIETSNCSQIV